MYLNHIRNRSQYAITTKTQYIVNIDGKLQVHKIIWCLCEEL